MAPVLYVIPKYLEKKCPCRYRQKAGFAVSWEPATLARRRERASNTPANETADLVSVNMAAPVRSVSDMRYDPTTPNRSGVYIYNRPI